MQNDAFITKLNLTFIICDHFLPRSLLTVMWHPLKKSRPLNLETKAIKKKLSHC